MELKDLLNLPRTAPFSRVRYLPRYATEEQMADFLNQLLVKAIEARETGSVEEMAAFLAEWEDFATSHYSQAMQVPESTGIPWAPFTKPLREARVALVTTGGIYVEGQDPFERGDYTFREIPKTTPVGWCQVRHWGYDITGPQEDVNCVLPIERFRELEAEGVIGELAETSYSFMGLIQDVDALMHQSAPEVAGRLKAAEVDAVFLTST